MEEEALRRVLQSNPGLMICSDQLEQGDGFSLCRRAIEEVSDLKVLMVLTSDGLTSDHWLSVALWIAERWPWSVRRISCRLSWK
jgi:DNA-binding response OmpR family regulator